MSRIFRILNEFVTVAHIFGFIDCHLHVHLNFAMDIRLDSLGGKVAGMDDFLIKITKNLFTIFSITKQ